MANDEYEECSQKLKELYEKAERITAPEHKYFIPFSLHFNRDDQSSAILEIRAGAGGQEAGLFALDLYTMYKKYSEAKGWEWEDMNIQEMEQGGYK